MSDASNIDNEVLTTADGTPLTVSLRKALRREKLRAFLLILPLLFFVLISFIIPITNMLFRSIDNSMVSEIMPQTVVQLQNWDETSGELPPEEVFAAFAADMQQAAKDRTNTQLGSRLNYDIPGISSKFRGVGRIVKKWDLEADGPFREQFVEADPYWGEVKTWQEIKLYSPNITSGYYASAIDRELTPDGWELRPDNERFQIVLFGRTAFMSLVITLSCVLLGYPIAWILSNTKNSTSNLLMILVLLPFWTSLLVRTSAWKVLLGNEGVINSSLEAIGLINEPLPLMYNQFGTIVAMTQILLPFMILPMYSVMRTINPSYLRAAKSMGARNGTAFWRVYFPLSVPGIGAGAILVFILAIGYYITPAIVGGTKGIFISNQIAYHIQRTLNWGLAASLGTILLVAVLILYWVYDRVVGIDNVKLG